MDQITGVFKKCIEELKEKAVVILSNSKKISSYTILYY